MIKIQPGKTGAALAAMLVSVSTLSAGTYVVTTSADSGNGSLRQAILNANSHCGGDITFYKVCGVIQLESPLPAISQKVEILGPGANNLTVSGSGAFGVFSVNEGVCGMISSLTIANGAAMGTLGPRSAPAQASGFANSGNFELRNCVFRNCLNFFTDGGAVFNSGTLQLNHCEIGSSGSSFTLAEVLGGGIYNSGNLSLSQCLITNCLGTEGGGIYNAGTLTVTDSTVGACYNDYDEGDGGGIYNLQGVCTLRGCAVTNCEAGFDGGAIVNYGDLIARDSTLSGNNALEGGAVFLGAGTNRLENCYINDNFDYEFGGGGIKNLATLTLNRCTLSSNSTSYIGGGGIENLGSLSMTNCTLTANSALGVDGGAILNTAEDWDGVSYPSNMLQITACTIASNTASGPNQTGGIEEDGGPVMMGISILAGNSTLDFFGVLNSQDYNLILNPTLCAFVGPQSGNIYGQPPLLGPLAFDRGHVPTMALLSGSPAIGAGPVGQPPFIDERGVRRPHKTADDIGAFEVISSHEHFVSLISGESGFQVVLDGVPGLNYQIQNSTSPTGPWTTVTNVIAGPNGQAAWWDTTSRGPVSFYRSVSN